MDVERGRCVPQVRAIGQHGVTFSWLQVAGRFLSMSFALGALGFIAWLYSYWRAEPTTRVDVLFPSFFPVILGAMVDAYELVSLLLLHRRRAINPVAVCFDIALIAGGIFCFLVLGMVDRGVGERRGYWFVDMRNAMIFMIIFSAIHAGLIILAAGGVVSVYFSTNRARRDSQLARSRAEMVQFNERQRKLGLSVGQ